eukprot:4483976-Pleurochrysis_carterae.AAC.2
MADEEEVPTGAEVAELTDSEKGLLKAAAEGNKAALEAAVDGGVALGTKSSKASCFVLRPALHQYHGMILAIASSGCRWSLLCAASGPSLLDHHSESVQHVHETPRFA